MNSRWHIILILLLLTGATGCSRFRELTRRDYALLRDPFVNRFSDDQAAGRVSMDDAATADASYDVASESTAANTVTGASAPVGRLSEIQIQGMRNGVTQSSGPSLSDFIDVEPQQPTTEMPKLPNQSDVKKSAAGFGVFAEKRTESAGGTVKPANAQNDFADWASQQHEKWNSDARPQTSHVLPGQIQQVSQTLRTAADEDGLPTLPSPGIAGYGTEISETATPLIHNTALDTAARSQVLPADPPIGSKTPFAGATSGRTVRTPSPSLIQPPTFEVSASASKSSANIIRQQPTPPVFNSPTTQAGTTPDPFADFDKSPNPADAPFAANASKQNATASGPVDSSFHFDTGWKPSNLTRP